MAYALRVIGSANLCPSDGCGVNSTNRPRCRLAVRAVDSGLMDTIRVVDIIDEATFGLIPPCADPGFDHRSCDYWEDAERGSKAARLAWLEPAHDGRPPSRRRRRPRPANPFLADLEAKAGRPTRSRRATGAIRS